MLLLLGDTFPNHNNNSCSRNPIHSTIQVLGDLLGTDGASSGWGRFVG